MASRKIVKSGNTSFVLSLPIDWVRKNNLHQGNNVNINENELGNLVISSGSNPHNKPKRITTIKVDGKDDDSIYLEFMNAYIRDSVSIIFEGKEINSKDAKIVDFVSRFIGLDIIERGTEVIVVKNFFMLDREVSPEHLLKKMDIVIRAEFDILGTFFTSDFAKEDFFEIQKLHEQNHRLFTLVRKCVLQLIEDPSLMIKLNTNHLQIVKDRIFAQAFTNASASMLLLGRSFMFLDLGKKEARIMKKIFKNLVKEYKSLLNAVNNHILNLIYDFLKQSSEEKKLLEKELKLYSDPLAVQTILSIINIYNEMRDIAFESLA